LKTMLREGLFLTLGGVGLIIFLLAGIPLGQWQWLVWSGYHASHWNTAFAYLVYLIAGVPLYLVGWAQCFRLFFVRRGADGKNMVRFGKDLSSGGITASVLLIALLSGGLHFLVLAPATARLQHSYHDWPAALQLTAFRVCATEVTTDWEQAEQARGVVAFEIVNLSPALLREATFTVEAGRFWGTPRVHRFYVRDLAPQAKQHVEVEADLGRITRDSETSLWPSRLRARLYYGRARFEGASLLAVTRRPVNAETTIGECAQRKALPHS
jgi:hypothetical protein